MSGLKLGFCNICEAQPIFENRAGRTVPNTHYVDIFIMFSDGAIARHGICTGCAGNYTEEQMRSLFEKIRETMREQLVGTGTDRQFERLSNLELWAWDINRERCIEKFNQYKEEKRHAAQ